MKQSELIAATIGMLSAKARSVPQIDALVGLDGFVDEIIRIVDKKDSAGKPSYIPTMTALAERIQKAAGKSTNLELIVQRVKLGGNGPIMANALAAFGVRLTYIGNLGHPQIHPVFQEMTKRAEVFSIAEPGHTDAVEFDDGKIMFGKHETLKDVNWDNLVARVGREKLQAAFGRAQFVALNNWTMLPHMSDIWRHILTEICPKLPRNVDRAIFFDLADPEKRLAEDIRVALGLITEFQKFYRVILGLNEKEGNAIAEVMGLHPAGDGKEKVAETAKVIRDKLGIHAVVVHPTAFAAVATAAGKSAVDGPFTAKPLISTGAGDHFNAGFCLGAVLVCDPAMCLQIGVATSGYYVRTAQSPSVEDLIGFLKTL
ncbi:MAG: hypothetical protein EXS18_04550 [Verrucomicrobiae bacterium]|nr:hypothetical protein [Verrucomicrobiae bacterium]